MPVPSTKMPAPEEVAAMLEAGGPEAAPPADKDAQLQELATQLQDIASQISALLAGV